MCCVLGYVGDSLCREHVFEGLSRLEYRGYDSAGYACYNHKLGSLVSCKVVGGVSQLVARASILTNLQERVGIGHTRWATNGTVTEHNAHPLFDCTGTCAVVHNGIIENEYDLKNKLQQQGHVLHSQTDTELVAHLMEEELITATSPEEAARNVALQLEGSYACILLATLWHDKLIALRRRSPLCIMRGADGFFVASDPIACAGKAESVLFMPDESYAIVEKHAYAIYRYDGTPLDVPEESLSLSWESSGKQGYEHYMLKEIYEQLAVVKRIADMVAPRLQTWVKSEPGASYAQASEVLFVGCGTSLYAASLAQRFHETIAGIPSRTMAASELRDHRLIARPGAWACALSQSGETADTLEAMRYLQNHNIPVIAVTNRTTSTMAREAHDSIFMHAGNEVAVASSKTLAAHISIFYILAHACAQVRQQDTQQLGMYNQACNNLAHAADMLQYALEQNTDRIDTIVAPLLAQQRIALTVGRGLGFVVAQEAALKLKELAYIFVEAYLAGELKHGPLALIEPGVTVLACSTLEERPYQKLIATVNEIRARKGHVIVFAFEGQHELATAAHTTIWIPRPQDPLLGPLVMLGVVQYVAYRTAYALGRPIDKPRNLAKSVTVE